MKKVIYIHGKNGSADEAEIYKPVFSEYEVIGLDYKAKTPWQAKAEFPNLFDKLCAGLTVMPDGEHWFHTEEQMRFLTEWLTERR